MFLAAFFSFVLFSEAQQTTPPTTAQARFEAWTQRQTLEQKSLMKNLRFRSVGPRNMGGRVVAIQGFSNLPYTVFAAYASGGLWVTHNNGVTWDPLFDHMPSITIGDFAVNPDNLDDIWVGTGEENSSRSSYAGTGIYHSTDGGRTWTNMGLIGTHHISKIIIHPTDPNTLWVGSLGALYTTNEERGLYKSSDGGVTWTRTLFVDNNTGVSDIAIDPTNPDRLYAATWERSRKAWNFVESGPGSGLYLSEDGGLTWKAINEGLPVGETMGRIGLSIHRTNPKIMYVTVDNQVPVEPEPEPEDEALTKRKLDSMDQKTFLALDDKTINDFLRNNRFHPEITAASLRAGFEAGDTSLDDIRNYHKNGNTGLFSQELAGVEVYRSDNGGASWKKTHDTDLRGLAYSYGYYFGVITVDPVNPDIIYAMGIDLLKSTDGGKTFVVTHTDNVHSDMQALWIDPNNSRRILLGNDGGIDMSWDEGLNWIGCQFQPVGQFYTVAYDMATPYRIYGGIQDNGVWRGPSSEQGRYDEPWEALFGGDGAFVQVDFRDNETIYCGSQFGFYSRINIPKEDSLFIYPFHQLREDPPRYNWMTPFVISRHHQDVVYMASQRVRRSLDQGATWEAISPDLTHNVDNVGDVPFSTITALRESPHAFGTLYAGTDDGRLWITRGAEWQEIGQNITQGLWVSSIEVSPITPGTVFVTMTGYRNDDFSTYVFMSEDYGQTWKNLKANLPDEACNVIRQDTVKENLLFLGTDIGLWISSDKGQSWMPHQADLPHVPVYAMEVHPREHELIVATHGRSIFVLGLDQLQQMDSAAWSKDLVVFRVKDPKFSKRWGRKISRFNPEAKKSMLEFNFFTAAEVAGTLSIYLEDTLLYSTPIEKDQGFRQTSWAFDVPDQKVIKKLKDKLYTGRDGKSYAQAGTYRALLEAGDKKEEITFSIK